MIASPFPGMDPYLESPDIWADLHSTLIPLLRDQLNSQIVPAYIANLDTDIVIDYIDSGADGESNGKGSGGPAKNSVLSPDVAIRNPSNIPTEFMMTDAVVVAPLQLRIPMPVERRLTRVRIIHRARDILVAVIELLSPVNKRPGEKREKYLKKRTKYLESTAHLIEIDLLRQWKRMPLEGNLPACDYLLMVSDANKRPDVDVWPLSVRNSLPLLPIPLLHPDPPVLLDIGQALRTAYARARYDLQINYNQSPKPALSPEDAEWATELIASWADKER